MSDPAALHEKAILIARLAVRMTARAGAGHPSSAMSIAHLVAYLLYERMRWNPRNPDDPHSDRLVLSEGHAVPAIYAAFADLGGVIGRGAKREPLTIAALDRLRARESVLDGHPNPAEGFPFFDAATGSLGMGLSVAAGLGLAARLAQSQRRVYVLIGDGESREGQIWEAADFVVDHKLSNVVAIFNCNGQGQAGRVSGQQSPERIAAKLEAYGWRAELIDGHDPNQIAAALATDPSERPLGVVARTIKGWASPTMQNGNWHGKPCSPAELPRIEAELDATRNSLVSSAVAASNGPRPPAAAPRISTLDPRSVQWPSFGQAMEAGGLAALLAKGKIATRRAYGAALRAFGDVLPQLVALDADVSNSTFAEIFAAAHPGRFFECKIAEQNMVSTAVGLAAAGYIPFASSFAKFLSRAFDQVELAFISRANVKLVGSHAGITPCSDGPSQMGLLDVAFFRAFGSTRSDDREQPAAWFFQPSDAVAAYHCTRLMIERRGLCYMRTHRPDVPLLYAPDTPFEPGGFQTLSSGSDLALIASGYMVHVARETAAVLARQNIRAAILDAYSLPLAPRGLCEAIARSGGLGLVVEDNYGGGVGAAVAEAAARRGGLRIRTLHVTRIPKSTHAPEEELEYCGLSPAQIADQALALLREPGT